MAASTPQAAQAPALVQAALNAFKTRDRDAAAALLQQAVSTNAALGKGWGAVSRLASTIGESETALSAARLYAASATPSNDGPLLALAEMLAQQGRTQAAEQVAADLARAQPNNAAAWHLLGACRSQLGQTEQSLADLRRAVRLQISPASTVWSWQAIAEAKRFSADDPDLAAMQDLRRQLTDRPGAEEARSVLNYALGKAYDDIGEIDQAFEAFAAGAAFLKARSPFNADVSDAYVAQLIADWTPDFHARLPVGLDTSRAIFVLGLPRSGTTLVEQILTSHSAVTDGAEINLFGAAAMPIKGFGAAAVADFVRDNGGDALRGIAATYEHLLQQRFGPNGRVIDKTLNHSRFVGLIARALPTARFIWLERHPGAVAWSCWKTRFARGADWAWSFEDMARHFRAEDRLRAHWSAVLGDRVLHVPYEALVAAPDHWINRIIDHVGLAPEAGLRDFHTTDRAVTTASFAQVRRPLYKTSLDAWRRYEARLTPFFRAYEGPRA